MQCIYNKPQDVQSLQSRPSYFLVFYHFGFETTTLTLFPYYWFWWRNQSFFLNKSIFKWALVDACLMWTDLIILISRPVCWDKLYQSTHFKGKLHKLPINLNICLTKIFTLFWFWFWIIFLYQSILTTFVWILFSSV